MATTKTKKLNLKIGNDLDGLIEEIAEGAGVTPRECLRAAVFYFANKAAGEYAENPQGLNFRFFTDEEEAMLKAGGHDSVAIMAGNLSADQQPIAEQVVIDCAVEKLLQESE